MQKIICSNCGIPNYKEAVFCQACGNKLSKLKEQPLTVQETGPKISRKRLKMIIIAVIIIDLIIGLAVFIAFKNN